ncbi:MAG TPA: EamA family transporter [Verrucomicrobiae bacterium]|nr:EamA family transporter [Verrucomicrobiae bacterium]
MSEARRSRAIGMLMLATPCWALSFPVMKALALEQHRLLPDAGSWFFTALGVMIRFGVAGLLLLPLLFRTRGKISGRELEQGIALALFGGAGIVFQMDGLTYTAASTSAFLTQGYTVFIPIWVVLTTRRRPSLKVVLCVALVLAGVAVLANLDFQVLKLGRGELETLIASLLFTGQILILEQPRYAASRPLQFSVAMFLAMSLFSLPMVWATAPNAAACLHAYASPAAVGFMVVLITICTLAGYMLMNHWQRRVTATEAGLIYCIEPVCASVLALFLPAWFSVWAGINYPNEHLTSHLLIGGALVTAANVLLQSPWLEKKRNLVT